MLIERGWSFTVSVPVTLTAALLVNAPCSCALPVTCSPRGPYCMMGVCFDCLVEIDGRPNQQGCLVEVRAGMKVARQQGPRAVDTGAAA